MKPIPLFGTEVTSYSQVVTAQRRLNVIYDLRKDQDRGSAVVAVGTPGSVKWTDVLGATTPVRGWWAVGTSLFVVVGQQLYKVSAAGVVSGTAMTLVTSDGPVSIQDNGVDLIVVDGVGGYLYRLATGAVSTITDPFFPNGATSVAFLNSRFIVNKPGTREFYVSAVLDGATWSYSGLPIYGTKENSSDLLVDVSVLNGVLILWGQFSIEFWQDVGTTPLPFQRINGATQTWGLAAPASNVRAGNTEMFLGYSPDGGIQVLRLNAYTPVPVSDSDINYLISNFPDFAEATALVYTAYGHSIYQLTFPVSNRTLAYDLTTGVWHDAQTGTAPMGRHYGKLGITFNGLNYITDYENSNIYQLDEDLYTDNGATIPREICTRHVRAGGNEVFLAQLMLDFETGTGNNPTVYISVSRDGGRTFGPEKQRPLGAVGQYLTRVVYNRLGRARDFVFKIRMTDAAKFVIASGSAVVEVADG